MSLGLAGRLGAAALAAVGVAAQPWLPQPSGVSVRLRGVSAVSDRVAWASGAGGTVLRTTDGGASWRSLAVPDAGSLDFRDVDAIDADVAYLLSIGPGAASRIYKTSDGGAHWQPQLVNSDPRVFLDAMAFWDERRGVVAGDSVDGRFVVLTTRDGGRRWERVTAERLPAALPNEGCFAASGTSLAVWGGRHAWIGTGAAATARVLRTTDGGATWSVAATPLASGPSAGIFSVAFEDDRNGVVVGGDYKKETEAGDNAAVSSDGGVTWTLARGLSGYRSAVAWLPGQRRALLAVGPTGADRSGDGGRTWAAVAAPGFHALAVARSGLGWAVGERGAVSRFDARQTPRARPPAAGR